MQGKSPPNRKNLSSDVTGGDNKPPVKMIVQAMCDDWVGRFHLVEIIHNSQIDKTSEVVLIDTKTRVRFFAVRPPESTGGLPSLLDSPFTEREQAIIANFIFKNLDFYGWYTEEERNYNIIQKAAEEKRIKEERAALVLLYPEENVESTSQSWYDWILNLLNKK